jgi:hypothetical protein
MPSFFLADSIYTPPLMTCATADSNKVKDCKIADGHTLDEVINYLLKSQAAQYDSDMKEKKEILDEWDDSLDVANKAAVMPHPPSVKHCHVHVRKPCKVRSCRGRPAVH